MERMARQWQYLGKRRQRVSGDPVVKLLNCPSLNNYTIRHAPDLVAEYWADKGGPIGREEARLNKRELALRQKARDKAASQSSQTIKKSEPVKPTATKEKETSATPAEKSETVEQAKAKGPAKEPAKEPTKEPTKESSNEPTNEPAKVTESQTSGTQEPGVKRFRITPKKPRIASASPSPEVQSSETYNKRPLADTDEIDSARNASKRARAVSPEIPDSPTSISQSPQRDAVETTMIFEKRPFPEPKREPEKESLKVAEQSKDDVAQVEKTTVPEQEREPRPAIEAAVPSNEQILEASVDEAMTGAAEKPSETEIAERNLHENETVSRLKDDSANLLNVTDGLAEETNELMDIDVPLETVEECLNERSKQDQTLPETTESTTEPTTDNIQSKNQPEQTEEQQMDILGDIENIQPASDNENLSDAAAAVREQTAKVPPINGDTALNVVDQMEVSRDAITEGAQTSSQMFNDYVESAKESQKITIKKKITELTPKDVIYDESFPYDPTDWDTKIVAIEAIVRRPDLERSNNLYAVVLW